MKYDACYYCDELFTKIVGDDGEVDHWEPECECEAREARREEAYWREVDRRIDEARGK